MSSGPLTEQLAFIASQRHVDEATVLADAVRTGVEVLYREALIEGYLLDSISRATVERELGSDALAEIEYQRDALKRDVRWGLGSE